MEEPDGLGVDAAPAQAVGSTRGPEMWGLPVSTFFISGPGVRPSRVRLTLVVDRLQLAVQVPEPSKLPLFKLSAGGTARKVRSLRAASA